MERLPAIDLGLMSEHLAAHEGELCKLNMYFAIANSSQLKNILKLQSNVMYAHVLVMLALINPYHQQPVKLPSMDNTHSDQNVKHSTATKNDKWIATEAHTSAKSMANDNFISALMMQDQHVRDIHVEMALQQLKIQENYEDFLKNMGWTFVPYTTSEEQLNTYYHFQQLFNR
ncbi:MAG: spore coat protein [Bacillota bacterium]|uniref:Spore coat protein n=1 Tax=Virgibacillus salarius TaxID=447199 RepID=A0A941DTW6_9BACI|nr:MULTISPECIES: spore coat protein [Bacillaceae]MBR7795059.1 spore coat protein [Virgibacillus salarius]MDY7043129.1 spore coat protein [Virgibacillus sp. M23]NAZ07777.1 hypothetical protein [Agaribacter marinus]WBX79809.1 spore coat protein [Virgibacillus salarius]